MKITITVEVENKINVRGIQNAAQSDRLWEYAAVAWHRLYKDWVPGETGLLYANVTFAPKTITHLSPQSHYLYEGMVYGPNIPIMENGVITGFFSIPNRPKTPTGKKIKYSTQLHPKASAKWDQAAAPTQLSKLVAELQDFVDGGGLDIE